MLIFAKEDAMRMELSMEGITTIVLPVLIGAVVSFVGSLLTYFLGTRTKIDEALRQKRAEIYKDLWTKTGLVPFWPKNTDLTYGELYELSCGLKNWYFHQQGGLYLSKQARSAYSGLQENLASLLRNKSESDYPKQIAEEDYDLIKHKGHDLRLQLTEDLLSRSRTLLLR
jgi:hypothetical protein